METSDYHYVVACVVLLLVGLFLASSTIKFMIKYALYHIYMVIVFAIALIPCCLRPGSADNVVIGRYIYYLSKFVWWLFGFDIITEGTEHIMDIKAPCVFMCNHQSSLDALVIAKVGCALFTSIAKPRCLDAILSFR